jgi:uncharacterized membrane protein YphA (DoxX/SURF4 family)
MSPFAIRMLIIFIIAFVTTMLRFVFQGISVKNKIEIPSKFQRFFLGVQVVLTVLMGLFTLVGLLMKNTEMTIMFFVMTVIFSVILFGIRRKFRRYYEENEESFYLNEQYMVNRIYYENITDWIPLKKRIGVVDPTQREDFYVVVNFVFHNPEILLRRLTEMTLAKKFKRKDGSQSDDPYREQEFIDHLEKNGYGYIIEEFLQEEASLSE